MKKKYRNAWIRAIIGLLLSLGFHFAFLSAAIGNPYKVYWGALRYLCMMATILQLFWISEAKTRIFHGIRRLGEGIKSVGLGLVKQIGNGLLRIYDFFQMAQGSGRTRERIQIQGYTDTTISLKESFRKRKKAPYYKRWKAMDNREKVRYLYYREVNSYRKKGYQLMRCDTPKETRQKLLAEKRINPGGERIFDIYETIRYQEGKSVEDTVVNTLKRKG